MIVETNLTVVCNRPRGYINSLVLMPDYIKYFGIIFAIFDNTEQWVLWGHSKKMIHTPSTEKI